MRDEQAGVKASGRYECHERKAAVVGMRDGIDVERWRWTPARGGGGAHGGACRRSLHDPLTGDFGGAFSSASRRAE